MQHYVYRLIDPRDGSTFYVGKGQKDRMRQHEWRVITKRPDDNYPKCHRIREILADGLRVVHEVDSRHESAEDAFAHEIALIAEIGLRNLTNIQAGGGPWYVSPELLERRSDKYRAKIAELAARFGDGGCFPMAPEPNRLGWLYTRALRLIADRRDAELTDVVMPEEAGGSISAFEVLLKAVIAPIGPTMAQRYDSARFLTQYFLPRYEIVTPA